MKIIIAGAGKVGSTIAKQLSTEGHDLTLIDANSNVLDSVAERYDVMTVHGNCAAMNTLQQAGAEKADLLIATAGTDEVNLLSCLTAHSMNANLHTIARIRNPEYNAQIYAMQNSFAISLAINPEKQAAKEIERLLKYPGFLRRDTFAKGRVEIVELRLDAGSKLCNVALNNMDSIVGCKVLVCTVLRSQNVITPDGEFVLREGDRVFVTAPTDTLSVLLKNLGIVTHKVHRVLLAGGGRISFYLADLLQKSGMDVRIIEKDRDRCQYLAEQLPDTGVIWGDASNQTLLESEGLNHSDALVTLTSLDELNMIISMYGGTASVPQIITKLSRVENAILSDALPLGSVVSPKQLCCNTIVQYVRAMQNTSGAAVAVHSIAAEQAEAIEFVANDSTLHCGEKLKDFKLKKNVLIVCITHNGNTVIPNGNSTFQSGDTIVVVASGQTVVLQLNDIFA